MMMTMMMVGAVPLMGPLGTLTVTSSLSSSPSTIRLYSSISESLGPVSIPSSTGSYYSYAPLVTCGRGDKKTAKGKRFRHSFGNSRPRNKNKGRGPPRIPVPARAPKQEIIEEVEEEEASQTEEVAKTETDESIV